MVPALVSALLAIGSAGVLRAANVSSLIAWLPLLTMMYLFAVLLPAAPDAPRRVRTSASGVVLSTLVWVPLWLRSDAAEIGVVGAVIEALVVDLLPAVAAVLVAFVVADRWRAARGE